MIYPLGALMFTLVTSTGCQEHRRLEAEAVEARGKAQELRTEIQKNRDDVSQHTGALNDLLNARSSVERQAFTPLGEQALEDEVDGLQAEKSRLEKDLRAVEEEHEQYRKANS